MISEENSGGMDRVMSDNDLTLAAIIAVAQTNVERDHYVVLAGKWKAYALALERQGVAAGTINRLRKDMGINDIDT